uniref:Uncharacterized protein n=1 Tax=Manihot esculenta TaxID=3983 RepID=A0A2C9WI87_MANES
MLFADKKQSRSPLSFVYFVTFDRLGEDSSNVICKVSLICEEEGVW